jgi:signal transduction histidine kinase
MSGPSRLAISCVAALAMTLVAFVAILGPLGVAPPPDPQGMLPVLVAAAGLCVAGLTRVRSPSVAWLATILVLTVATLSIAAWGRSNRAILGPVGWQWLVLLVGIGAVASTGAAMLYATERPRRLGDWVAASAFVAIGVVGSVCVWVYMTIGPVDLSAPPTLGDLALVTRSLIVGVLVFTGFGIVGDLQPARRRTSLRLGDHRRSPGVFGAVDHGLLTARTFIDELTPGGQRARRAAGVERTRIAVELHAEVVPVVRRALREAEEGGSPERLAVALRDVLAEVDGLATDRHSVALDELGLLAAIEWLAERTEERSAVRVSIEVDEAATHGLTVGEPPGRPPRGVETAAFRVAQLALENVVRHAPSASATIHLTAEPRTVRLSIRDDGPGISDQADAIAAASGRRGLADMRAAAAGCGGSLTAGVDAGLPGTVIRFVWPAD